MKSKRALLISSRFGAKSEAYALHLEDWLATRYRGGVAGLDFSHHLFARRKPRLERAGAFLGIAFADRTMAIRLELWPGRTLEYHQSRFSRRSSYLAGVYGNDSAIGRHPLANGAARARFGAFLRAHFRDFP